MYAKVFSDGRIGDFFGNETVRALIVGRESFPFTD